MKKPIVAVSIALSLTFLWLAARNVELNTVFPALRRADPLLAIPILIGLAGFYWLRSLRWRALLLPEYSVRTVDLFKPTVIGAAGNNLLPAHLGELIRMYILARDARIPKSTVLATLVAERAFDIVAILLLVLGALTFVPISAQLLAALLFLAVSTALAFTLLLTIAFRGRETAALISALLRPFSARVSEFVRLQITRASVGLSSLKSNRLLFQLLLNSLAQWIVMMCCIEAAIIAVGIQAPISASTVVLGLIVVGLILPTSPGFVGTIELAFVLGLKAFGVPASEALTAAIYYHVVIWSGVTFTGLILLRGRLWNIAKIAREADR